MEIPEIYAFIVTNNSGIPKLSIIFDEEFKVDDVLFSGFISAITQFLSEILSSREMHTQFAQADYEGLITEIGENYYCLVGNNIFSFHFDFYYQLFSFIEKEISGEIVDENKINQVRSLLMSAVYTYSNPELVIPFKVEESTKEELWVKEAEIFYNSIDGNSNLKELSSKTGISIDNIFAFFIILQWLDIISFKIEVRDYLILEKSVGFMIDNIIKSQNRISNEISAESYEIYKTINGKKTVSEIKKQFPTLDVKLIIEDMLRMNIVKTVTETKALGLIISDYFNFLISEMMNYFNEKEVREICNKAIEESKAIFLFPLEEIVSPSDFNHILESLKSEGYSSSEIVKLFVEPVKIINSTLRQKNKNKSVKIFAAVFNKLIEKHGFTLERMGFLHIFCPEEYLS
ncbi:MAG: hypothetical protein ACTSRR_05925 [Candidatus Heimdallarchaeaceae archaeon]